MDIQSRKRLLMPSLLSESHEEPAQIPRQDIAAPTMRISGLALTLSTEYSGIP